MNSLTLSACLTLLIAAVIGALTLLPIPLEANYGSDKLHHFTAFFAVALPLSLVRPKAVVPVILSASAYGGMIEILQPSFGRTADWMDFFADTSGAIVGGLAGVVLSMAPTNR